MDGFNVDIVKLVCYWGQRLTMLLMLAMMPIYGPLVYESHVTDIK